MRAAKRFYRQMTRAKASEIRRAYFAREANQPELARRYGIAQNSVSRIISGQVWAVENGHIGSAEQFAP